MEQFLAFASGVWSKIVDTGPHMIQDIVFALSGYEISELWALAILLGSGISLVLWLLLRIKRPKKVTYLMEGGHRYYRP